MVQLQSGNLTDARLIGVDWGTSSFRAYLLNDNGELLDRVSSPSGILNVPDRNFAAILDRNCGQWPNVPTLMCGMIGSRNGWIEADYLSGLTGASELAAQLKEIENTNIRIVPGISGQDFSGGPDVMRGEETLLVGALALGAPRDGLICLPGTHSKWVNLVSGRIAGFSTYLTGEVFALMRDRSILSPLMEENAIVWDRPQQNAFVEGVEMARDSTGLLHQLFSLRARVLTGHPAASDLVARLSGLMIGAELLSIKPDNGTASVSLITSGAIGERYRMALEHLDIGVIEYDAELCCQRGLHDIALAAQLPAFRQTGG
ncbi:2-dehydro-3-deoxygalactonokinase [Abyssibius alkaniclasticus]|uniref:2-dehydro-3-deoxygalactonokinase n=1 Tax=Abyssibius alkaniclasticus TaxID=2881234 RepID=UPI0023636DBE|nr:2-dehydro-3-deoxygalactonokinase [Abyssibius alkaniclasticus]UPH70269.1 2-dehydro-3-deoxygalactonokinase [Abyssibius alkaniclasticus]